MRMELYRRQDGALVALLHGIHLSPAIASRGYGMELLGVCRLPQASLSDRFFRVLGREGWAEAHGEDRSLLLDASRAIAADSHHISASEKLVEPAYAPL